MDTAKVKQPQKSPVDIPSDSTLPGMTTLLNPELILDSLKKAVPICPGQLLKCRVAYVRYKPNTNCIVTYVVTFKPDGSDETKEVWLSGKCYSQSDFETAVSKRSDLIFDSVLGITRRVLLKRERIVILPAEQDSLMKGLETAFDSRKLVRLLHKHIARYPKEIWRISDKRCQLDFIRFKPEKRAVLRLTTKVIHRDSGERKNVVWYVRAYARGIGSQQFQLLSDISEQFTKNPTVGVAVPLAGVEDKDLIVLDHADGTPLEGNIGDVQSSDSIQRVGHALALLHTFRSTRVPVRTLRDQFFDISSNCASLKNLVPDMCDKIDQVVSMIESLRPKGNTSSVGFVHGDFHPGQILIGSDRVNILDFDRAHVGDPICDIGSFTAYLHVGELRAELSDSEGLIQHLVDGYCDGTGRSVDMDRVRFWTLVALFGLAVSPFRLQRSGWRQEINDTIERCLQL